MAIIHSVLLLFTSFRVLPQLLRTRKVDDFIRPKEFTIFYWIIIIINGADTLIYWLIAVYYDDWKKDEKLTAESRIFWALGTYPIVLQFLSYMLIYFQLWNLFVISRQISFE
jgi:hypothetical protein